MKEAAILADDTKAKVGDWVFCEFKLQVIKEIEDGKIKEVSDGAFCLGSSDLSDKCFSLTMEIKNISDTFYHWRNELFKKEKRGLNGPDINRWLIEKWVTSCLYPDKEHWIDNSEELYKFCKTILDKCREMDFVVVDGVNIFR